MNGGISKGVALVIISGLVTILSLAASRASAEDAGVPDPSAMAALLPDAAKAPAPAWAKPGTRMVYYGASAVIPAERTQLVLDPHGRWVNKATGQGMGEQEVPGPAGEGYTVVQIGYADKSAVALTATLYMIEPITHKSMFSLEGGMVTTPGCAADVWVNPDVLKKLPESNENGVLIMRMPYTVNKHKYNAIRIQTQTGGGSTGSVYDLDSGAMIFLTSSAQGAGFLTAPPAGGGLAGHGKGSTTVSIGWLMEIKDMQVPWAGVAAPAWVAKFGQLDYGGQQSIATPGVLPLKRPLAAALTPKARGAGWVRTGWQVTIESPMGMPPEQSAQDGACGSATIGGLWIAPEEMAKLKQGQELDRDDIIKTVTSVTTAGPRQVTISEVGPLHRRDWTYDGATGMLVGLSVQQQTGMSLMTHSATLTGQK